MTARIAPSILSADFARLADEIAMCEVAGADWIHVDVMDGHFVPNLTFGAKVIETVRRLTDLPLDVHLMVIDPQKYFDAFVKAGASLLSIHVETVVHLHRQLHKIRELGCQAGVVLNPATPVNAISEVAADVDLVLVMSVNPGFAAQEFIPAAVDRVARVRQLLDSVHGNAALEVDGGISRETIGRVWRAGADTFVAGNAVFTAHDPAAEIAALRALCTHTA